MPGSIRSMAFFKGYRLIPFITLLAALSAGCSGVKEGGEAAGPAVITVGGRAITAGEYSSALKRFFPEEMTGSRTGEVIALKKEAVAQLIEEELILGEAERLGLAVSTAELEAEVEGIRKEAGDGGYEDAILERYGSIAEWKKDVERKLLMRKAVSVAVGRGAEPTEEALKKYYREHASDYAVPEKVRARMIVVGSEDEARGIRAGLTALNFAEAARKSSLSPEASSGGDLGFFGRGEMPREFEDAVFALKPGGISGVVRTEYGYHIFLLEERRARRRLGFEEARDRIRERLGAEGFEERYRAWISSLREKTPIEVREELL